MGAPGGIGRNFEEMGVHLRAIGLALYQSSLRAASATNATLAGSLRGLQSTSVQTSASSVALGAGFAAAGKKAGVFSKDIAKAGFILGRMQFVVISTVAALAGLGAPVIFAARFEEQLSRIAGLTNVPREAIQELRDEILALSKEVAISPEELGAGAYFILSSGIEDTAKAVEVLRVASLSAVAGLGETEVIARTLTAVMNAYSLSVDDAATITDQLVQATREGAAEPSDLAATLGRVIPIAAQMGVEFAQVGAVLAQMTNIGLSTERAVTGLIGIFNALLRPSERSKELFKALGFEVEEFRKEVDENFVGAMLRLFEAIQGNEQIVAELFPDLRGLIGVLAAFGRGEEVEEILNNIAESAGALDEAVIEATDTVSFKFRKALNDVRLALTRLGQTLLPTAGRLFENISKFVERATAAARDFRDEWGPTLREFGRDLADIIRRAIAFGVAVGRSLRQAGALVVLRALGEVVKFLARNFDILGPAIIAFTATALAATLIPRIVSAIIAIKTLIVALTTLRTAAIGAAVGFASFPLAFAAIVGSLALGTTIISRLTQGLFGLGDAADDAERSIADMIQRNREVVFRALPQGLSQQQADLAALATEYDSVKFHIELVRDAQSDLTEKVRESEISYKNLLDAALAAPAGSDLQSRLAEQAREGKERFDEFTAKLEESEDAAEPFLKDLERIKEEFDSIDSIVDQAELAAELEKMGRPAEDIRQLLPDIADEFDRIVANAGDLGEVGPQTFNELVDEIIPAEDALRRSADLVDDLTEAFGGLGRELDKILGIETVDTLALDLEIALRRAAIAEIETAALTAGRFTDEQERQIGVLNDEIDLFNAQKDSINSLNEATVLALRISDDFNLTEEEKKELLLETALGSDAARFGISALGDVLTEAEFKGRPFAEVLKIIIERANQDITLSVQSRSVAEATTRVDELNTSWAQLARGAVEPITLQVRFETQVVSAAQRFISGFLDFKGRINQLIEDTAGRTPIGGGGAAEREENPFQAFIDAEQVREILLEIGRTGEVAWRDVGRLWSLGFKDAANDLAAFMRGELSDLGQILADAFKDAGDEAMGALVKEILDGTVDALDALNLLEAGMVAAAKQIVDALAGVASDTQAAMDIITEVIESGVADITQVAELLDLGAIEEAIELLKFLEGQPSEISGLITERLQRFFPTFRPMHEGAFIPPGPPVPAMLHGPEAVLPLGNLNALNALQRALMGSGGGSASGFRNYGNITLSAESDSGHVIIRSFARALGV